MDKFILYTTHCPKCKILEKKLIDKKIEFVTIQDQNEIVKTGFKTVPILKNSEGKFMDYYEAVKYINAI